MRQARGVKTLLHDAVQLTTELVREGIVLSTHGVLDTVQQVNRAVQVVTDAGLDLAEQLRASSSAAQSSSVTVREAAVEMRSDVTKTARWAADAALGVVNGVVGDHLHHSGNGLDLGMSFRVGDSYVTPTSEALRQALPNPSSKVALFVHGLAATEWSWCLSAETYHGEADVCFGKLLARDLGYTPVWLRYNSGRHVSENGRLLATELERFLLAYPATVTELVIIGHSMGGLLSRSACHYGTLAGLRWPTLVRHVFCLGSPHRGAPLEKLGNVLTHVLGAIALPATRIPARILAGRSAGIKDLRHGALLDEDWLDRDPDALRSEGQQEVPLLAHVCYHFVSATVTQDPDHPVGRIVGDLLVRVPSSQGPVTHTSHFAVETLRFGGIMHHQLQNHRSVYEVIRRACADPSPDGTDGTDG